MRLGSLTKAMKATQRPMPMKSMRAQWPVSTHTQTTAMETVTERSSARVNLPHSPSEILLLFGVEEQGRTRYWGEVTGVMVTSKEVIMVRTTETDKVTWRMKMTITVTVMRTVTVTVMVTMTVTLPGTWGGGGRRGRRWL